VDPQSLGIKGSTQPEVYQGTVDAMVKALHKDAARFWQDSTAQDGPIEVWEIGGERYIYNGNHRFHAAVLAGVNIPASAMRIVDMTGTVIPTFLLQNQTWLPGLK